MTSGGKRRNRDGADAARRSFSAGIPVHSGAGVGEGELGEDFGPTAERRQCLAVAEVLRNAEYTVAQCGFRSKLQDAVAARFWGCAGIGDEVQGSRGCDLRRAAGVSWAFMPLSTGGMLGGDLG